MGIDPKAHVLAREDYDAQVIVLGTRRGNASLRPMRTRQSGTQPILSDQGLPGRPVDLLSSTLRAGALRADMCRMSTTVAWGLLQWGFIIFVVAFIVRRSKRKTLEGDAPSAHRTRVAAGLSTFTVGLVIVPLALVVLGVLFFMPLTPTSAAKDLVWNMFMSEMKYDKDELENQTSRFDDGRDAHYEYRVAQRADDELTVDTNFPGDEHPIDRFYLRKACAESESIYVRDEHADGVKDSPNARRVTCRTIRSASEQRQVRRLRRHVRFSTRSNDEFYDLSPRWYDENDTADMGRILRVLHSRQRPALIVMTEQGDDAIDLSGTANLCRAYSAPWRSIAKHWHIKTIRKTQPPIYDPDGWGVIERWGDRPYASAAVEVICAPGSDKQADTREAMKTKDTQTAGIPDETPILIGAAIMAILAALWCDAWGLRTRVRRSRPRATRSP